MEREQYAQLLASRRRAGPRGLDESRPLRKFQDAPRPTALGRVVAKAARGVKRRAAAAAAWQRIAPPVLVDLLEVVAVRSDVIELEAASPSARFEFERERARLERGLCQAVPGARRVMLVVAGDVNRAAGDSEGSA